MKEFFGFCFAAVIFASCTKSVDLLNQSTDNKWTIGNKTFNSGNIAYQNIGGQGTFSTTAIASSATSNDNYSLKFTIFGTPTVSGLTLPITNTYLANTSYITYTQIIGQTATVYTNKLTNVTASVNYYFVDGTNTNKLAVSIPGSIWLYNKNNATDSVAFSSGTLIQN